MRARIRRSWAIPAMAILLALTTACAAPPPSPTPESADELEEFRQDILTDVDKIDGFLLKTQRGVNLSEFNLGWFTMILLNELGSHDQGLYDHLHAGEMNVEYYLRNTFQADPKREIAAMEGLARTTHAPTRMAARHALEMLTAIPSTADSPEIQAQTRKDLKASLVRLKSALTDVADEAGRDAEAAASLPAR